MKAIEQQIEFYRRKCATLAYGSPEWYAVHAQGSAWIRKWRETNTLRAV